MDREKNPKKLDAARGFNPSSRFAYTAISTPPGVSGVAVIRMCGDSAFEIADEIFSAISPAYKSVLDIPAYSCAYGKVTDVSSKQVLDYVVLTKFNSPNSYTGEDTIEISCHGGHGVKNSIMSLLYSRGARPALAGEFTKNAFLNGKIDLSQAEAVMDLISSNARMSTVAAAKQLEGDLSNKIRNITSKLYELMARVEMIIEFPEHEESSQAINLILEELVKIGNEISALIETFQQGRILKEGFSVAIAGKPNAGKSSMLNALIGYQRAIVTDIPGTTRDTVEEMVEIEGLPVKLIDTAGIRNSSDEVEKIGISIAKKTAEYADLILWISSDEIIDTKSLLNNDDDFGYLLKAKEQLDPVLIIGKSDIIPWQENKEKLTKLFPNANIIPFSAVTGEGIKEVRMLIKEKYEKLGADKSRDVIVTNHRHFNSLSDAKYSLDMATKTIEDNMPADILASALRSVADKLSEITGDQVSEELVDEIFRRFCVGK